MFARMQTIAAGLAMALAAATFQGPSALAQTDEQWDRCEGYANVSQQAEINACTQILNSPHLSKQERAWAYYNRAASYNETRQYALALRDLDESIRLDPRNAYAYWERHIAKERLGDNTGAQADYIKAKQLKPGIEEEESGSAGQPRKRLEKQ